MNSRTLAVLAVRLIAIYLIAIGITQLPNLVGYFNWSGGDRSAAMTTLVFTLFLAPLIVGILLWPAAPMLGHRIVKAESLEGPAAPSSELVQGAIAVAGLVIAATAIPGIIMAAAGALGYARSESFGDALYILIDRVLVGLVGLALVVGARRLRKWIFNVREIGT